MRATFLCLVAVGMCSALPCSNAKETAAQLTLLQHSRETVLVPMNVAMVVRPILDLRQESINQCGAPGMPSKCTNGDAYNRELAREKDFNDLMEKLITQKGPAVDEGLVVLMCFYVGESGEEVDSVVSRGRRMLPYLQKYQNQKPFIPDRMYTDSMLIDHGIKQEHFRYALHSIK